MNQLALLTKKTIYINIILNIFDERVRRYFFLIKYMALVGSCKGTACREYRQLFAASVPKP